MKYFDIMFSVNDKKYENTEIHENVKKELFENGIRKYMVSPTVGDGTWYFEFEGNDNCDIDIIKNIIVINYDADIKNVSSYNNPSPAMAYYYNMSKETK